MGKNIEAKAIPAVLLTSLALLGAPEGSRANFEKVNTNQYAAKIASQVGGKILRIARSGRSDGAISAKNSKANKADVSIFFDSKRSKVAGASGKYTMRAVANLGRDRKLQPSDINYIRIYEGSETNRPVSAISLQESGSGNKSAWTVKGHTANTAGLPMAFEGSTAPTNLEGTLLGREDLRKTSQIMRGVISNALNGQPTQPIDPPFGPVYLAKGPNE